MYFIIFFLFTLIFFTNTKLFIRWLILELVRYTYLLLLFDSKSHDNSRSRISNRISYFLIQTVGSIIFFYSIIFDGNLRLLWLGISIKLGLIPFFWWLPYYCHTLRLFSFFIYLTWRKLILIRLINFFKMKVWILIIIILNIAVRLVGMYKRLSDLKLMISWGSLFDTSLFLLVSINSLYSLLVSYFFYTLFYLLLFILWTYISNYKTSYTKFLFKFFLLIILGLPLFFRFFYKIIIIYNLIDYYIFKNIIFFLFIILIPMILQSCFFLYIFSTRIYRFYITKNILFSRTTKLTLVIIYLFLLAFLIFLTV